jgi:hypothetical protein
MYLLGTTGADFDNKGAASITLTNCGLIDDSSSGDAIDNSGSLVLTAKSIGVVGNVTGGGTYSPTPTTGIARLGDPLNLTAPSTAGCGGALSLSANTTISPGCYNGLTTSGSANITLNPGLYVINGPVDLGGSATLQAASGDPSGVTIFFNNTITINGAVTMQLSAPTTGAWNGILFFEDPADTAPFALTGAAASNLQGIIYLPSAKLDLSGATAMTLYTAFVVNQLQNNGSIALTLRDYLTQNPNSPLANVILLE